MEAKMEFLFSHWHCILPAAAIIAAVLLMRDKPKKRDKKTEHERSVR
jgi:hypothetical protein